METESGSRVNGGLKVGESAPLKTGGAVKKKKKVKCIREELGRNLMLAL